MEIGLSPGGFVLETPLPSPKKGPPRKFSAHVYCGQMVGWIEMVPGMVVGLSPVDFVLDRDPPPP